MTCHARMRQRLAFTLIEVVIAGAIFATAATVVTSSLLSGGRWISRISNQADLEGLSNRVLDRLVADMQLACGTASQLKITPPALTNSTSTVYQYRVLTGFDAAGATTFEDHTLTFDSSVEDDGRLFISTNGGPPSELCRGIPTDDPSAVPPQPAGFTMSQSGNIITIGLTLTSRMRTGELVSTTSQGKAVYLRAAMSGSGGGTGVTVVSEPADAGTVSALPGPSITCGNMVTTLATNLQQISLLITTPIGQQLDTNLSTLAVILNGVELPPNALTLGIHRRDETLHGCHLITLTGPMVVGWTLDASAQIRDTSLAGYRTTVTKTY